MKVIIAGSRDFIDYKVLCGAVNSVEQLEGWVFSEIVSGTARGVDRMGEAYARQNNIKIAKFPANWDLYGKKAGYLRNAEMADYADALLAIWDGKTKGTKNMIDVAKRKNLKVFIWYTQ